MRAGVLLALIETADVVRARTGPNSAPRRVLTTIVVVLLWAGVAVVAVSDLGIPVIAVLAALWIATTTPVCSTDSRPESAPRPVR